MLGRTLIYLNNACLTPVPRTVAQAVKDYYDLPPACPLRSKGRTTTRLEERIHEGRDLLRSWLGARFSDEIVYTLNTTASINLLAGSFARKQGAILLTDAEHNSNRLPWLGQEIVELTWPPEAEFPLDDYRALLARQHVKLVTVIAVSNVTGAAVPVREVVAAAHERGIPVHIDAAQQASHGTIDVTRDRPDFLSMSLHKAYGPSGLGVLYATREARQTLEPAMAGGGSVDDHHGHDVVWTAWPARFEFGLQNYSSQYAVAECVAFLRRFSAADLTDHFLRLNTLARQQLSEIPSVRFIGPADVSSCGNLCNFYIEGIDSHRVADLLDLVGDIHVRAGMFCAHHYYHRHELPPSIRFAFGYHNTEKEVFRCVRILRDIIDHYLDS